MIPLPRLLDSNLNEIRRIRPISVSITEDIVPLSTASMRLMPGDSVPYRSYVELFTPNGSAGVYRAKMPTERYGNPDNSVNLEHAICELGDYIVKGTIKQEVKTLSQAVNQVFGYYGGTRWQLGAVNVTADVLISADYSNVLQTINSLIEQAPGAMMAFDFSTNPWTFSIVAVEGSVSAEGRLSRNVASAEISRNDSELCTRVWLNHIASTAEQSYMDADTIGTYGVIERVLTDRNYTTPQAQQVASKYLAKHKHPTYSVQIDGLDLSSITGESLDRFAIGKKFRLTIPEDQQKIEETIVNLSWYDVYESPTAVRVTLSEHAETETSIIGNLSSEVYGTKADSTKSRTYLNQTDYKIELVAEQVEDVESELDNKYTIRSGIEIKPEGVEISGGKYINIKSGSSFNVESGGNIDINGSGNLKLTGSTVEIKSGSTFDVEANNIVVDSNLGRFVVKKLFGPKNFYFGIGGLTLAEAQDGLNGVFSPYMTTTIRSNHETYNAYCMLLNINDNRSVEGIRYNTRITFGTEYVVIPDATTFAYIQSLRIKSSKYVGSSSTPEDEPSFLFVDNIYLTNKVWAPHGQYDDVRTGIVYYVALIQESSKDIKHNIQNLPSVGDKLDHLKPVTFVYDNDEKEQQRMGLIYEDTVEVMPEICTNNEANKAINYVELIPALLKEIQELRARVAELERRG